jgi:hypothetical protein
MPYGAMAAAAALERQVVLALLPAFNFHMENFQAENTFSC